MYNIMHYLNKQNGKTNINDDFVTILVVNIAGGKILIVI